MMFRPRNLVFAIQLAEKLSFLAGGHQRHQFRFNFFLAWIGTLQVYLSRILFLQNVFLGSRVYEVLSVVVEDSYNTSLLVDETLI